MQADQEKGVFLNGREAATLDEELYKTLSDVEHFLQDVGISSKCQLSPQHDGKRSLLWHRVRTTREKLAYRLARSGYQARPDHIFNQSMPNMYEEHTDVEEDQGKWDAIMPSTLIQNPQSVKNDIVDIGAQAPNKRWVRQRSNSCPEFFYFRVGMFRTPLPDVPEGEEQEGKHECSEGEEGGEECSDEDNAVKEKV